MKKLFALLLALTMSLSLVACGGNDAPVGDDAAEDTATEDTAVEETTPESDAAYIEGNGKLVVGITIYEPMNYYDDAGNLTGFDTEFAQAVCDKLGLDAEFQEINWDTKEIELAGKTIDCIWNGMTITPDRAANMSISLPYVKNAQVIVVKADSSYASTADLVDATLVAEIGSAGEAQIEGEDANADLAQAELKQQDIPGSGPDWYFRQIPFSSGYIPVYSVHPLYPC